MEHPLKPISKSGIAGAFNKVAHYRNLNQSEEAESICRDILALEPENSYAQRLLGLVITDQFTGEHTDRFAEAENIFRQLSDPYERQYYTGILHERRAKAQLQSGHLPHTLVVSFEEAMRCYGEAEKIRPTGNDDSILRWNRCVRLLQQLSALESSEDAEHFDLSDSPPV